MYTLYEKNNKSIIKASTSRNKKKRSNINSRPKEKNEIIIKTEINETETTKQIKSSL